MTDISRAEAIRISKETMEKAEQERYGDDWIAWDGWAWVKDGLPEIDECRCSDGVWGAVDVGKDEYQVSKVFHAPEGWAWADTDQLVDLPYKVVAYQPIVKPMPPRRKHER